jgi:hypothetical protein
LAAGCGLSQPAPTLRAVSPAAICAPSAVTLTLDGDGFVALPTGVLRAQSIALPSVVFDGPMHLVMADDPSGTSGPVRYVSSHQLLLDVEAPPAGQYAIAVTNPDGQSSALAAALAITDGPTLTMVVPGQLCDGSGGTVQLTGTGFVAGATVKIFDPQSGMSLDGTLLVTSPTQATATFPAVPFAKNQDVDLILTNPDGCAGTLSAKIRIKPGTGGC